MPNAFSSGIILNFSKFTIGFDRKIFEQLAIIELNEML